MSLLGVLCKCNVHVLLSHPLLLCSNLSTSSHSFLYKPWERQQQLESARVEKVATLAAKQSPGQSQRDSYGAAGCASPNDLSALLVATPAKAGGDYDGRRDSLLSPLSQQNVSKAIGQVEDDDEEAMQAFLSIHITKNMTHLLLRAVGEVRRGRR